MIKEFNILKDRVVKVIQLTFSNKKTLSTSKNKYIYIYKTQTQMGDSNKNSNGRTNKTKKWKKQNKLNQDLQNLSYLQDKTDKCKKDFNLKSPEIQNFLITILEIFEQINNKAKMEVNTIQDLEDQVNDMKKLVGVKILNFLDQDIDSLDLP